MRYKVSEHQLDLLNQNFMLIEDGLLLLDEIPLLESSMPHYNVSMWIAGYAAEIRIGTTTGSGGAMAIARKMFPKANVYSAKASR